MHEELRRLGNRELVERLKRIAAHERKATAALVAHLAEVERRGLHRDEGYSSAFEYCVKVLRLSEGGAYSRIYAARLVRRYPSVLALLQSGELSLSALRVLGPKLTGANHAELLAAAAGKTRVELEALLAERFPAAAAPTVVRKLPEHAPAATADPLPLLPSPPLAHCAAAERTPLQPAIPSAADAAPTPTPSSGPAPRPAARPAPPALAPLSADRFKVQFTASRALHDKLQTARRLMRHRVPDGDVAAIVEQALDLLIDRQMKRHFAQVQRPRAAQSSVKEGSRHIPAAVRRAVAERDGMRCTFMSDDGHRCEARERLEYHHERAFALGGEASERNIRLLCQSHNQLMAERDLGPLFMAGKRSPRGESRV